MLNRFKNALYGPSSITNDEGSNKDEVFDYREGVLGSRIRNVIKRSTSFHENLRSKIENNNNVSHKNLAFHDRRAQAINGITGAIDDSRCDYSTSKWVDDKRSSQYLTTNKSPKFRYSRPEFLQLKTEDEILVSADHQIRPIILPRDATRLPWRSGYAECINAGKSRRNEDQAACYQDVIIKQSSNVLNGSNPNCIKNQIPWFYFGIFDGHAGTAVAVAASLQLHNIIAEKLRQVSDLLIALEFDVNNYCKMTNSEELEINLREKTLQNGTPEESNSSKTNSSGEEEECTPNIIDDKEKVADSVVCTETQRQIDIPSDKDSNQTPSTDSISIEKKQNSELSYVPVSEANKRQKTVNSEKYSNPSLPSMIEICRNNVTVESLIKGALESAFWEMDMQIAQDKHDYKMAGGCTAIVSLFILGKLYVCNAGDSRAIVYMRNQVIPMSFDFTPTSEKERVLKLGLQRPEFLGDDFTHLEFVKKPTRKDLGKQMLYRDAYMTGWSMKTITYNDLKFPLVWGEGKRSRVLATIGVTRGFGDHELKAQYGGVSIKPFLTPEPEVKVLPLEDDESLSSDDVLIIGSDGLWDVTSNQEAADIVKKSFEECQLVSCSDSSPDNEESRSKYKYITAAQDLVIQSRGHTANWNNIWRTNDGRLASLDDIAVFVIPLKQYRDDYIKWKQTRIETELG